MLDKNKIATVVEKFLGGGDKFLVEVVVSTGNVVDVFVDGDDGITISECAKISRHIVSKFDRDLEDFELRVSSPGLNKPFKLRRQYKKYINHEIEMVLNDGNKVKGKLLEFSDEKLVIERNIGKKKKEFVIEDYPFSDFREAKPVISFK